MLGIRSNALRGTISKPSFPCGKECDRGSGENWEQQSSVNPLVSSKPPFLPQQVIVGFDIRQEPKPFDPCESPRSVLDLNVPPREGRPPGGSLRPFLGPLKNKGSQGVGLAIIVELQAEEKRDHASLVSVGKETATDYAQTRYHRQPQSHPIEIGTNSTDKQIASRLSKFIHLPGTEDDADLSSIGSAMDMECLCSDYLSPWQAHLRSGKTTCEAEHGYNACLSIFSVASVPSSPGSFGNRRISFLDACAFCKQAFSPEKDLYMYRGDQAFCSVECRLERIKVDEYKEKARALYSKN